MVSSGLDSEFRKIHSLGLLIQLNKHGSPGFGKLSGTFSSPATYDLRSQSLSPSTKEKEKSKSEIIVRIIIAHHSHEQNKIHHFFSFFCNRLAIRIGHMMIIKE